MSVRDRHDARESRLLEIREEAAEKGRVEARGIRAAGSPLPLASAENGYYRQPLLKEPQWTPLIPLYFFVGGAAGSLGIIGSLADVLGNEKELARNARWMATGGAAISSALLVMDLGRPSRFLNMLRVFKPQSAMSMGSWVLSAFSTFAAASSFADLIAKKFGDTLPVRVIGRAGRAGSVVFGMPFHNYTGVLIGASAIPVWNHRVRSLPREFGMSGLQSAVGLLELAGHTDSEALNALALMSAAIETWESVDLMRRNDRALEPAKQGWTGMVLNAGAILSGPAPIALRLAAYFTRDKRRMRKLAAVAGILGSLCMRYGWVHAGKSSARDWRLPLEIDAERSEKSGVY